MTVKLQKNFGYYDVTKYPYGGCFKRFKGDETGEVIDGPVDTADEKRLRLSDGRIVVTLSRAIIEE